MAAAERFSVWLGVVFGRPRALLARADALVANGRTWDAFPLLVRAGLAGLTEAQRRVGECYLTGQGVPLSLAEGMRWLTRAAEAGDADAQTQLASLALQGARTPHAGCLFVPDPDPTPDFDVAERWSRRAARSGSAEAQALLGLILTAGPPDRRDPAAGRASYRDAATGGSSRGRLALAMTLLADGTPDAARDAQALLREVAAERIPAAQFLAGAVAESGAAGEADLAAAAQAYRAAAEQGHATAQCRYGLALLAGRGVSPDPFAAETWLRRAAVAGDVQAAAAIGDLYAADNGGLPPNHAEAAVWFLRAAEAGHAGAARRLGHAYLHGKGVRQDASLAADWLRAAIAGGEEMARVDMARLSLARQSTEADQRETAAWFRRLADAGNRAAWFNLGLCLAEGIGLASDTEAAAACFSQAADAVPAARQRLESY